MTATQSQKLGITGAAAATAMALCWAFSFVAQLNAWALLILVPYIMPLVQSLDPMTRLWVFTSAPMVQFSLYGFILGRAWLRGRMPTAAIVLAAFHLVAIIVCYLIIVSSI